MSAIISNSSLPSHDGFHPGPITASLVPTELRPGFLPKFFGSHFMKGEALVYSWLTNLCDDYNGGFWNYYTLSNGGFYMAPTLECSTLRLSVSGNYFDDVMSPDAAGIVATMFAMNHLMAILHEQANQHDLLEKIVDRYHFLRDYISSHPEGRMILRAID